MTLDFVREYFERAKVKGHSHVLIMQTEQADADNLTCFVSGSKGKVWNERLLLGSGIYGTTGAGMAFVGTFELSEPWETHAPFLRDLDF